MDNRDLISKVKEATGKVISTLDSGREELRMANQRLYNVLNSHDFKSFKESLGKATASMPQDFPGVKDNVYWNNFIQLANAANSLLLVGQIDSSYVKPKFFDLAALYTHLSILECAHLEDIDAAYRSDYKPVTA